MRREGESQTLKSSDVVQPIEPARFQLDVLVAQYAEVLRESYWAEQAGVSLKGLAEDVQLLKKSLPEDEDVQEFVDLVRRAARARR